MGDILIQRDKDGDNTYFMVLEDMRQENPLSRISRYLHRHDLDQRGPTSYRFPVWVGKDTRMGEAMIFDRKDAFLEHDSFDRRRM